MNKIHLIYMPFRGVGIKNGDDTWFAERIGIFKDYTLKSLLNQTNRKFMLWCSFRLEDKYSWLTKELSQYLDDKGMPHIFSFDGLMYYDDRNLKANETLEYRLQGVLTQLQDALVPSKWVIVTRIDSDDMFHKHTIETIQAQKLREQALVFFRGLVYNTDTKELAEWKPRTNPPFHTIIFKSSVFYDAKKHLEYFKDWTSHEDTMLVWPITKLPDYFYCVTVHPRGHISTNWDHHFKGKPVDIKELNNFLGNR